MKITILIPVYNDWQSVFKLLENINLEVSKLNHEFSVIIVNDYSNENMPELSSNLENFNFIKIINMKKNQGHARCNATGLKYIIENDEFDYVIPMDGDGEDRPEEIKNFIDQLNYNTNNPIVGERIKRSEGMLFKICYFVHKIITLTFTGQSIKFGNYTCLPRTTVEKLTKEKSTWNSFSGALTKVSKDRVTIPSERGIRYFGPSKMSFKNLIIHSLSIIGVFKMNVLIRSIIFLLVYIFIIYQNTSAITLIPVIFVILLNIFIFKISKRENLDEFNNCLTNILDINTIKEKKN